MNIVNISKQFKVNQSNNGIYPLITRPGKNNGITEYINDYSVESGYFTIAPSGGSTGHCFYHPYPIAVDGLLKILKLNESVNINHHLIDLLITYNFSSLLELFLIIYLANNNSLTVEATSATKIE